jgi:hypothetical protein
MDGDGGQQSGVRECLALAGMFGAVALRYWTGVFPGVCRELARWRRRALGAAGGVPDRRVPEPRRGRAGEG